MCRCAGVVQSRKYSRRTALFNKVAYNFVIEVFDRCPLDLLSNVLFLFCLQRELDEDLLKLLVDIINA